MRYEYGWCYRCAQNAKFVVALGDKVAPSDIEEGMRVGCDRTKHQIQIPLPPKIDPTVTMMTVEEKPDVTYNEVGGNKEQIEKMREVVELPMLHPVILKCVSTHLHSPPLRRCAIDLVWPHFGVTSGTVCEARH